MRRWCSSARSSPPPTPQFERGGRRYTARLASLRSRAALRGPARAPQVAGAAHEENPGANRDLSWRSAISRAPLPVRRIPRWEPRAHSLTRGSASAQPMSAVADREMHPARQKQERLDLALPGCARPSARPGELLLRREGGVVRQCCCSSEAALRERRDRALSVSRKRGRVPARQCHRTDQSAGERRFRQDVRGLRVAGFRGDRRGALVTAARA
jgi:hypothetical protein